MGEQIDLFEPSQDFAAFYEEPPRNSSFSEVVPLLQLAWDSTSLGAFKTCQRYYKYSIIDGYCSKTENVHLKFGIIFHAALELYDRERARGQDHNTSVRAAVRLAMTKTWDKETSRPWQSFDLIKNRHTLIRTIIDYLDHFEQDTLETVILSNGKPAVELSFRFELDKLTTITTQPCPSCGGSGEIDRFDPRGEFPGYIPETCFNCDGTGEVPERFLLCGHIDKLVRFLGDIRIKDVKTTKYTLNQHYFYRYSPDNQVSLYSHSGKVVLSEEVSGMIIDGVQIRANDTVFQRGIIERSESFLAEWLQDAEYYISLAEVAAERNYYPQNDKACGGVFENPITGEVTFGCIFRPVCGAAPEVRQTLLDLDYTKRTWDPLKPRES